MPRKVIDVECVRVLKGHRSAVLNVKFTANGAYCMSTSQDKSVVLWNPVKGLAIKEYKGPHNHEVNDVSMTTDNSRFATCGGDKSAFLWDVTSGKIHCCEIAGDNGLLLTGCYDKAVRIWDMKAPSTYRPIQVLTEAKDAISSIIVTNEKKILTTSVDGCLRCYDLRAGRLYTDKLPGPAVRGGLSRDERCIAINCLNNTVQVLEVDSGQHLNVLRGHKNSNYSLNCQIDPDDSYIISGSEDGKILVWDICADQQHNDCVQEISPSNTTLAIPREDQIGMDWGCVFTVRFHPTQWLLLSSHNDATIRIWRKQKDI